MRKSIGSLLIRLGLEPKEADAALKKFEKNLRETGKRMESIGRTMSIGFTAPFLLAIGKSIQAYNEEAQVVRKLQIALGGTSKALLDQAAAMQQVTLHSDDEIITQQAWAAALGHSEQQILAMTEAAAGASAALGIGLDEAMKGLHKTTTGVPGALGKLIPEIKNMTKEQLLAGEAIDLVREKFEGFAEAAAITGSGPLVILKNSLGDLMEQMGEAVLPIVLALTEKIKELIGWFANLDPEVKKSAVSWGILVASVGPMLILLPKLVTFFTIITSEIALAVAAVLALAGAIIYVVKNWENLKYNVGSMIQDIGDVLTLGVHKKKLPMGKGGVGVGGGGTGSWGSGDEDTFRGYRDTQSIGEFLSSLGNDLFSALGGNTGLDMIAKAEELMASLNKTITKTDGSATSLASSLAQVPFFITGEKKQGWADNNAEWWRTPNDTETPESNFMIPEGVADNGMSSTFDDITDSANIMRDAVGGAISSMIGNLEAGGKSFGEFALEATKAILQVVQAELIGMAMSVIFDSSKKGGLPGMIAGIVAATAGIAVVNSLLSGIKAPKLAAGGMAYGPTMAMVGDNPNAHIDPEVISPLSKLKQMFAGKAGGGGDGYMEFRIRGNDLVTVMRNANYNTARLGNVSFGLAGKSGSGGDG